MQHREETARQAKIADDQYPVRSSETPRAHVSQVMQHVHTGYAVYMNRTLNGNEHLFQGRFKALLVDMDQNQRAASEYIPLNPAGAQTVRNPLMVG